MIFRILTIVLLCCSLLCHAQDDLGTPRSFKIDSSLAKESLLPWASLIEDATNQLTAEDILQKPATQTTHPGKEFASFGFSHSTYWLRISTDNLESSALKTFLVVKPTWLDDVEIFQFKDGAKINESLGGDFHPFGLRPVHYPNINFELSIPPGQSDLLIRIRSSDPVVIGVYLYQPTEFFKEAVSEFQYLGIILGVLGALILYNFFLFLSTKDRVYIAYTIYLSAFLLVHLTLNGHSHQLFWPDSPILNNFALAAAVHLYMLSGSLFAIRFLELREKLPAAYRMAIGFTSILAFSYLVTALSGYGPNIFSATAWAVIYGPFVLILGIWSWRRGNRAARFFLLGTMSGLAGSCITALTTPGVLPFTFVTFHAVDLGMMVDAVLLSFALADRMAIENSRLQANLEQRVSERTKELRFANERLHQVIAELEELTLTDSLTHVSNKRHFQQVYDDEWKRSMRSGTPLCLMIIDIDCFKLYNDTYGHLEGDRCLQAVANTLDKGVNRASDLLARFGGEEFVILLSDTSIEDAALIAARLVESIRALGIPNKASTATDIVTISLGLAQTVPKQDADPHDLLTVADQALYRAKAGGRNRYSL